MHKEYLGLRSTLSRGDEANGHREDGLGRKVDAVSVGYATCQKLSGIPQEVSVPSVMLEGDDCISVLLGPVEYAREGNMHRYWFSSPGWAEQGMAAVIKELHLDSMVDQGYDPMYFVDMIFDAYRRCLYIDTGIGDRERCEALSREFAAQLKLPHDTRSGSVDRLAEGIRKTKELAAARGG